MNRSLKSFSLIEMLVVMLLSTIIIGIIYFSYYNVTRYQMDLTRRFTRLNDFNALYFLLKQDFDRGNMISIADQNIMRISVPQHGVNILYEFNENYIVRRQGTAIDTFKCQLDVPEFLTQGKPLKDIPGCADGLRIHVTESSVTISVQKQYDAAFLLETIKYDTL